MDSRERILVEAMRLFGEQGYAATTIAQIERAAGLSPGSGALYRHFRAKGDVLAEGVRLKIAENAELLALIDDRDAATELPLREGLAGIVRMGLHRLDRSRDLNRILFRDLREFPELLADVRRAELEPIQESLTAWLRAWSADPDADWEARADILSSTVAHFWQLRDIFGTHPGGIDDERHITAFVDFAEALLRHDPKASDTKGAT